MRNWIQINNIPIRFKLISHFLIIGIIPILCLGLLINWTVKRVVEEQVNENTLQLISKVNETLEFYMNNMQSITYYIGSNEKVIDFLGTGSDQILDDAEYELQRYLRKFTTLSPEVAGILVVNNQGNYISNELIVPNNRDLTKETWYKKAINNKGIFTIIGQPTNRSISSLVNYKNDEVVTAVRAIIDPFSQEVQGVILIDLKLRVIAETLVDVRLGKSGYLMVVDGLNETIYQPDDPLIKALPEDRLFTSENSGSFSKEINNEKIQFIYQRSPFTNWTTIGVFPTKETIFEIREIQFYLIVFIMLILFFGIPVSYFFANSISSPISQLMSFMRKAEAGKLNVRYEENRYDEIGMLGRSFNKMLSQINELMRVTERNEREKRQAEFKSLQANINPHFLYNTLDTIQWMARRKNADEVAEVVESLAKLFRIGLSKGRDMITVDSEFEHIESYLLIQKTRYREKLNYQINVDQRAKSLYVLKFILQPIVENAIYHGIKQRRGPGNILVSVQEKEDKLIIVVQDDGIGMSKGQLHQMRQALNEAVERTESQTDDKEKKGYGILNVQARILLAFGKDYGIQIDSQEQEGTTVELMLPILKEGERPNA
ncbi:cache domain-containing sensor histidine kinase [Aquibacillus salsiterrae]|uniref:Sensor histidine kinase n=1 Tax=Aquibacillus salsiterrae TaxID=2950439 RepID=A0A9X3WE80_9BACI|nr:sensor histidine kinase [Aquibacillus salsiterrae]MDC3418232.1 sensor histidine kinase [Aquibacillus salsiterrae]